MASSAEIRRAELAREAPICPRGVWKREGNRVLLCGTIGPAFDAWQRRLAVLSAADAYFAQQIGLDAVEREMDDLEADVRAHGVLSADEEMQARRSPGYGDMPLELSRDILMKLEASRLIGVSVTDSNLLVPSKSVTAICQIVRRS